MKISSNTTAIITNNYLFKSENALAKSMGRLSSGSKVNHSSDNPAGYAISSKMRAQIESLKKAVNNSQEGLNALNIAESGMAEIQDMVKRMYQLSVKAANGTTSDTDREAIQDEIIQLKEEIDSIGKSTEYNSMNLLDGSFNAKAYIQDYEFGNSKAGTAVGFQTEYITSTGIEGGLYSILAATGDPVEVKDEDNKVAYTFDILDYNEDSEILTLKSKSDSSISMSFKVPDYKTNGLDISEIRFAGYGELVLQTGANEGQTVNAAIAEMSCSKMGIEDLDVRETVVLAKNSKGMKVPIDELTPAEYADAKARGELEVSAHFGADKAIDMCNAALDYVTRARSKIGAYSNRLESRISTLDASVEDLTKSYSTIMDTDMAEEMTEYSRLQVLEQAGVSMLAQANKFPQEALQLLQ